MNKTILQPEKISYQIVIDDIAVKVTRKNIKSMILSVNPPDGNVRLSVPSHVDDAVIQNFVHSHIVRIKQDQARFQGQERESPRDYVSGESHYFQGQRYLLNVERKEGKPTIEIRQKKYIDITVPSHYSKDRIEETMQAWYRQQLTEEITPLIEKWARVIGVEVPEWSIRQMKTRWGSCSAHGKGIRFNLELSKKARHCVEYVILHELVHLIEFNHSPRFWAHMDRLMPLWRVYRSELNALLKEEKWK